MDIVMLFQQQFTSNAATIPLSSTHMVGFVLTLMATDPTDMTFEIAKAGVATTIFKTAVTVMCTGFPKDCHDLQVCAAANEKTGIETALAPATAAVAVALLQVKQSFPSLPFAAFDRLEKCANR